MHLYLDIENIPRRRPGIEDAAEAMGAIGEVHALPTLASDNALDGRVNGMSQT